MGHVTVEADLRRQRAGRKERIDLSLPLRPLFSLLHQRRLPQLFIAHAFQMVLVGHIARKRRSQIAQCLARSEEHTSELQSLMRISYAVFCLKKKKKKTQ